MKTIPITKLLTGIAFQPQDKLTDPIYICQDATIRPGRGKAFKEPSYCLEITYKTGCITGKYTIQFLEAEKIKVHILPQLSTIEIPNYLLTL